jgi:peptidoglycan/LPS O-acetylase OafA/YrhL
VVGAMTDGSTRPPGVSLDHSRNLAVHYMRGFAAAAVVISHLWLVFFGAPDLVADYLGALPVSDRLKPVSGFFSAGLFLGQFGVGLFFVISGYVIPKSLETYSRAGFFQARFWRLWPTYAAGFSISLCALWLMHRYFGAGEWRFSALDIFVHYIIGIRDLAGTANIDGIIWTLEVEVKYYLVAALVYSVYSKSAEKAVFVLTAAAFAASWLFRGMEIFGVVSGPASALLLFVNLLILMNAGTVIQLYDAGRLGRRRYVLMLALHAFAFFASGAASEWAVGNIWHVRGTYALAAIAFIALRRRHFPRLGVVNWLGQISYPLYVVHAAVGYSALYWLIVSGIPPAAAFFLAIVLVLAVSGLLHQKLEIPSMRRAKACKG